MPGDDLAALAADLGQAAKNAEDLDPALTEVASVLVAGAQDRTGVKTGKTRAGIRAEVSDDELVLLATSSDAPWAALDLDPTEQELQLVGAVMVDHVVEPILS